LLRYTKAEFKKDHNATVGVEFGSKNVDINPSTRVKLQIWDTAGQESFKAIVRSFYRNAAAIFVTYDVNRRRSFENLGEWLEEVRNSADAGSILVLIGNKVDTPEKREVSYDEGTNFMQQHDMHFFFETSALDGTNVDKAFVDATKLSFMKLMKDKVNPDSPDRISSNLNRNNTGATKISTSTTPTEKKQKGCC